MIKVSLVDNGTRDAMYEIFYEVDVGRQLLEEHRRYCRANSYNPWCRSLVRTKPLVPLCCPPTFCVKISTSHSIL